MLNHSLKLYYPYWNKRLTVLAYHRIVSDEEFSASGSKIAVSTSVSEFERQMCLIKKHFSLINIETLQQWLKGQCELPLRPVLITFDDGYQDVYTHAMPVLERLNIPTTVFLATGYMGSSRMFQWDIATYCFEQTSLTQAKLPLLGQCSWETAEQRKQCLKQWVFESKKQQDDQRQMATVELAKILQVNIPTENKGSTAFLTWVQIKALLDKQFSFGSHSCDHPILSKISDQQLLREVLESKQTIENKLNQKVFSFAYPNGLKDDFNQHVMDVLKQNAYQVAFTLLPGPSSFSEVKAEPLQIRRVTVTEKDNWQRFILKLMGLVRLKAALKK